MFATVNVFDRRRGQLAKMDAFSWRERLHFRAWRATRRLEDARREEARLQPRLNVRIFAKASVAVDIGCAREDGCVQLA